MTSEIAADEVKRRAAELVNPDERIAFVQSVIDPQTITAARLVTVTEAMRDAWKDWREPIHKGRLTKRVRPEWSSEIALAIASQKHANELRADGDKVASKNVVFALAWYAAVLQAGCNHRDPVFSKSKLIGAYMDGLLPGIKLLARATRGNRDPGVIGSLDEFVGYDGDDAITLGETVADRSPSTEDVALESIWREEDRRRAAAILDRLTERDREVLRIYDEHRDKRYLTPIAPAERKHAYKLRKKILGIDGDFLGESVGYKVGDHMTLVELLREELRPIRESIASLEMMMVHISKTTPDDDRFVSEIDKFLSSITRDVS